MTRCLEKDPNRRYPRAAEVARELRRALAAAPGSGRHLGHAGGSGRDDRELGRAASGGRARSRHPASGRPPAAVAGAAGRSPAAPAASSDAAAVALAATTPMPRPPLPPSQPPMASMAPMAPMAPTPPTPPTVASASLPQEPRPASALFSGCSSGAGAAALSGGVSSPAGPARPVRPRRRKGCGGCVQRWIQYGLLGLAGLTVVTLLALWATGKTDPQPRLPPGQRPKSSGDSISRRRSSRPPAPRQPGIFRDPRGARVVQQADPENAAARDLRAEIERVSLDLRSAAEREQQVSEGLILAREEYANRRYESAIAAANGVLALVPEHPEAVKLAADSGTALARQKRARAIAEVGPGSGARPRRRTRRHRSRSPQEAGRPAAPDAGRLRRHRRDRLLLGGLRGRPDGLFRRAPDPSRAVQVREEDRIPEQGEDPWCAGAPTHAAGWRRSAAGLCQLPGKPTKAIVVEGDLVGGSTRRLIVRVDAEARVSAALE